MGRIVIVGAGLAGLACASELVAAGREVLVLEARDRVGGRTCSVSLAGLAVDGGADMIGANHPMWLALAERFGLELVPCPDDHDPLEDELAPAIAALCRDAATVDAEEPWRSPEAARLDALSLGAAIDALPASAAARRRLHLQFMIDMNLPTERLSYLGILAVIAGHGRERYWSETEAYRCRGGAQRLADALAATIAGSLRLACPVASIAHRAGGCSVVARGAGELEAEAVVLAVPPPTWARIAFDPPLPAALSPQFGAALKYLAAVDRPFWREVGRVPDGLSDGPLGETWSVSGGERDPALVASFAGGPPALASVDRRAELERQLPGLTRHLLADRAFDWTRDPWTGGGYAYQAPGQVMVQGPLLHRGLGPLLFAGEHTCFPFMGFMEGGLQSGVRIARRLLGR